MLDLGYVWFLQDEARRPVVDALAQAGKASAFDLPRDRCRGEHGKRIERQLVGLLTDREQISPELLEDMAQVEYPLYFIDLESLRTVIPPRSGGRVNGLTLFQLSVHTCVAPGSPLVHHEWLHADEVDPNAAFVTALRSVVGDEGSILTWSEYEAQSLSEILRELPSDRIEDGDAQWLHGLLQSGRIVDQHRMCYDHYWHPLMGGSCSIKKVLRATWSERSPVKQWPPFSEMEFDVDPYAILQRSGAVSEGCGAMEAYLTMQSGAPEDRVAARQQLLAYCGTDTLAQVFIWSYWAWRLSPE